MLFEELFEIWTWAQLGFHHKPCGLLNVAGYYDHLIQFLDHVQAEQFVKKPTRDLLIIEDDPEALLTRFLNYQAPPITTWLSKEETYPLLPILPTRSLFFNPNSFILTLMASIGSGSGMG